MKYALILSFLAVAGLRGQEAKTPVTYPLPFLCQGSVAKPVPRKCGDGSDPAQANNAAEIATTVAAEAKFGVTVQGNALFIVCKATCLQANLDALEAAIDGLARIQTVPPAPSPGAATEAVDLPFFCFDSTGLRTGAAPLTVPKAGGCGTLIEVQGSNAAAIATALSADKTAVYSATAQGTGRIILACQKAPCAAGALAAIKMAIATQAQPSAAYIAELYVPDGKASDVASDISRKKPLGMTAEPVGSSRIRLTSGNPVSAEAVQAILDQFRFGGQAPPTFRMFYQLPTAVAQAAPAGGSGNTGSGNGATTTPAPTSTPPASATPTTVTYTVKSDTSGSVTPPATSADAQKTAVAGAAGGAATAPAPIPSPSTSTTTATTVTLPPAATPPASNTPSTASASAAPVNPLSTSALAAVGDNVVFTDTSNDSLVWQRVRLLTLLDLPHPEVLMNVWTYQVSSPDGREALERAERVRDLVSAHNDALEDAIQFGWSYVSAQMSAQNRNNYFYGDFYKYITQKFVFGQLDATDRDRFGFCSTGVYCLGFTHAFEPVRPNLTSILLAAIASSQPLKTILTTIACMEGKYEVYPQDCLLGRNSISEALRDTIVANKGRDQNVLKQAAETARHGEPCQICGPPKEVTAAKSGKDRGQKESKRAAEAAKPEKACKKCSPLKDVTAAKPDKVCTSCSDTIYENSLEVAKSCLRLQRRELLKKKRYSGRLSCEVLDAVALEAQEKCGLAQTFPLSCFTVEAVQGFSSYGSFPTFTLKDLNEFAEEPLAQKKMVEEGEDLPPGNRSTGFGTTRIGLLRAAVADFLFNYKMSQEFPQDFTPYDLQHSAQELNAELNPLVVAFNEDVAAFSRHISDHLEADSPKQYGFGALGHGGRSFVSDGIITVRGIGGFPSVVNTQTQNFFDATQAQTLNGALSSLSGQSSGSASGAPPPATSILAALEKGTVNPTTALAALAAITPPATTAKIGRELDFSVIPHTLPGASSAELEVTLNNKDIADPALYQSGSTTTPNDPLSRVASHYVQTRVRVESIKMFELSSFSALLQRPRSKIPLVPPFVELPVIGSIVSLPRAGAREYHRSTAIVSAVIVPTAADLAYGIDFTHDREVTGASMRAVSSLAEFGRTPIRAFHKAMINCFASNGSFVHPGSPATPPVTLCGSLAFGSVPAEF